MSAPAVLMIAGTIPLDLLVKSAGNPITGHFWENNITKWQRRWNNEDMWNNEDRECPPFPRLIPDIKPWI